MSTLVEAAGPELEDVASVLQQVWSSFVDDAEPLLPVDPTALPDTAWSATVSVSGAWVGMVSIDLPASVATTVAHRMLAIPADEPVGDSDVVDAVGELANVLGGNVKSLMPGPSELSLPVVSTSSVVAPSEMVETCALHVAWGGPDPLRVRVLSPRPSSPDPT